MTVRPSSLGNFMDICWINSMSVAFYRNLSVFKLKQIILEFNDSIILTFIAIAISITAPSPTAALRPGSLSLSCFMFVRKWFECVLSLFDAFHGYQRWMHCQEKYYSMSMCSHHTKYNCSFPINVSKISREFLSQAHSNLMLLDPQLVLSIPWKTLPVFNFVPADAHVILRLVRDHQVISSALKGW